MTPYHLKILNQEINITFENYGGDPEIMNCPVGTAVWEVTKMGDDSLCSLLMPATKNSDDKHYPLKIPTINLSKSLSTIDPFLTDDERSQMDTLWEHVDPTTPLFIPDAAKEAKQAFWDAMEESQAEAAAVLDKFCEEQKLAEIQRGGSESDAEMMMESVKRNLQGIPPEFLDDMIAQWHTQQAIKLELETMNTKMVTLQLKLPNIINIIALLSTHCRNNPSSQIGKLAGLYKAELVEQLPRKSLRTALTITHSIPLNVDGVEFAPLRESGTTVAQA